MFLAVCTLPAAAQDDKDPEAVLKRTIVSLHKTRAAVIDRQAVQHSVGMASAREQDEAMLFVAYLDGRIYYYCRQRYLSLGPAGLEGLPCPNETAGQMQTGRFAPLPENTGMTRTEKLAQLDQELNSALGEFDDMLLQEEEKVAAHIPRQGEGGGATSGSWQDGSSSGQGGDGAEANAKASGEPGRSTDPGGRAPGTAAEEAGGGLSGSTEQAELPSTAGRRDLEEGDDDIVARQLREAAEQETDPEVKERLWEEYRKYQEGIR